MRWGRGGVSSGCRAVLLALVAGLGVAPLRAELPLARLFTVFPPGGRQGTTVEVTVTGADLDDAHAIYFSAPGISATPKLSADRRPDPNRFVVHINSNVTAGIYDARVVGRFGITNPRAFVVGDCPELIAATTNTSAAAAMPIALETTVNGRARSDAVDYFQFPAKQGQQVLIDCAARDLDSRMDAVLVVNDDLGHELDRSRSGGLLDFTAPADGRYTLNVHDQLYRGGDEFFYRLTLETSPRVDWVVPPAGLAGSPGQYVLYGRNLPGGVPARDVVVDGKPMEQLTVEIHLPGERSSIPWLPADVLTLPAAAVVDGFEYRLESHGERSNPVWIRFADAPVVLEQASDATPDHAQTVSLPCEFVGRFHARGRPAWITFEATKGDRYEMEVYSQRLGQPVAPFLFVQRVSQTAKGELKTTDLQEVYGSDANIGGPEFNTSTRDPVGSFEAKETGHYRVQIRDLFNESDDNAGAAYRLSIRKPTPDFRLVALPQPPPLANKDSKEVRVWTTFLRRGETTPVKILVFRRDHFNGAIELGVDSLPPGVVAGPATVATNESTASILLTAADTAVDWFGSIRIVGRAQIDGARVVREARGGTVLWNVGDYSSEAVRSRLTRNFALAVSGTESAPLSAQVSESKLWETTTSGKLQIPIRLVRHSEVSGKLKLKAAGLPALESTGEIELDGNSTNAVLELDVAQQKIPVGTHIVHAQLQANVRYRKLTPEAWKTADTEAKTAEDQARHVEQTVAELKAAATQAANQFTAAKRNADGAAAEARPLDQKRADARSACEHSPADPLLLAAKMAAEKEAAEADARYQAAKEAAAAAEKVSAELSAKLRNAEKEKATRMERAKTMMQQVQSQDVAVTVYSQPIRLRISPAPMKEAKSK